MRQRFSARFSGDVSVVCGGDMERKLLCVLCALVVLVPLYVAASPLGGKFPDIVQALQPADGDPKSHIAVRGWRVGINSSEKVS